MLIDHYRDYSYKYMANAVDDRSGQTDILALLASRRSPYAIDPQRDVSDVDIHAIFEAARWTMSASNIQPWRYVVGVKSRDDGVWENVLDALLDGNKPWAKNAPVLAMGFIETLNPVHGKPNNSALHDLGASSACLTMEAVSRGLVVHQMAGISAEKAEMYFSTSENLRAITAIAIGYFGTPSVVPEDYAKRDLRPRERKPLDEIIIAGSI